MKTGDDMGMNKVLEEIVGALNRNFDMDIEVGEESFPQIQKATMKGSTEDFLNEILQIIEQSGSEGKLNYYFDNEIDFDTPEEYHRY